MSPRQRIRLELRQKHGRICHLCQRPISQKSRLTLDHLYAKSQGGPDEAWNYALAHGHCNRRRGDASLVTDDSHFWHEYWNAGAG